MLEPDLPTCIEDAMKMERRNVRRNRRCHEKQKDGKIREI